MISKFLLLTYSILLESFYKKQVIFLKNPDVFLSLNCGFLMDDNYNYRNS